MLTYTEAVSIPNLAFPMVTLPMCSRGCYKIVNNSNKLLFVGTFYKNISFKIIVSIHMQFLFTLLLFKITVIYEQYAQIKTEKIYLKNNFNIPVAQN
jgi:hypothetical protein